MIKSNRLIKILTLIDDTQLEIFRKNNFNRRRVIILKDIHEIYMSNDAAIV